MSYNPDIHHRRSIQLQGYDYAEAGAYFVTLCTQGRMSLFGAVVDGDLLPTNAGLMVESWWGDLHRRFPTVATDAFIVMPNHLHGIVIIGATDDDPPDGSPSDDRTVAGEDQGDHIGSPLPAGFVGATRVPSG